MTVSNCTFRTAPAQLLQIGVLALFLAAFCAPNAALAGDDPGYLTRALGLRTVVPEAPDFVVKARGPAQDFIPVHTPRVKPDGKPMVKDEVAQKEKTLDSARIAQDRLSGRGSAPVGKSVADAMDTTKAKRKPKTSNCGLTCANPGQLPSQSGKEAR